MQEIAHARNATHQPTGQLPDTRLSAQRLSDALNELVGAQRLIIRHLINAWFDILYEQRLHHARNILDAGKRALILKGPQWPRDTLLHHLDQELHVALVPRPLNHRRAQNKSSKILKF